MFDFYTKSTTKGKASLIIGVLTVIIGVISAATGNPVAAVGTITTGVKMIAGASPDVNVTESPDVVQDHSEIDGDLLHDVVNFGSELIGVFH